MSNNKHNADLGKEYNGLHPTMILINMAVLLVLAVIVMAIAKDKLFGFVLKLPLLLVLICYTFLH